MVPARSPRFATVLAILMLLATHGIAQAATSRLSVANNGRWLVQSNGSPFFWMGDTNWRLYKLNRDQVDTYLDDRRNRGFSVIQGPVLLHASNGLEYRDGYGNANTNPTAPNIAYFQHMDYIIDAADARGLYVAAVCVWGSDIDLFGSTQNQRIANARAFGQWLGQRYRDRTNVIWIVAGEYNILGTDATIRQVWNALGNGLKSGSGGTALVTIHASYQSDRQSSSTMFHNAGWLDFNMLQSSQSGNAGPGADNWRLVSNDWSLNPIKPVIDAEAHYEGLAGWNAFGVRRRAYWSVFAGAFGHTYGSIPVALSYRGGGDTNYYGNPDRWDEALAYPGANDMRHLRRLMESRPMLRRLPADEIITSPHGGVPVRMIATRDQLGRYAMVYVPRKNKTFTVNTASLSGAQVRAWWYDCRTGKSRNAGLFPRGVSRTFQSPGVGQDWVLVLDNAAQGYPRPGIGGPRP